MEISVFKCTKGHEFLLWEECPFCCAIENRIPNEKNANFLQIYKVLKGMSIEKIEEFYNRKYLPQYEPETQVNMSAFE